MTAAQKGAYCTLLFVCFQNGGKLPSNARALQALSKCNADEWDAAAADLVRQQFTPHPDDPDKLTHHLVLKEVLNMNAKSEKGKVGADARWGRNDADAMQTHSERNADKKKKEKENKKNTPQPPKGALDYSLPLDLMADPKLVEAWGRWNTHLAEKKVRRTQSAITAQINKLRQLGALAVPTIDNSITNNWQGLFEPKQQFSGNSQPKNEPRNTVPRGLPQLI
jgi:uncharacterized protein YdaU (DUF1376 family)